jgi:hypothetical protein
MPATPAAMTVSSGIWTQFGTISAPCQFVSHRDLTAAWPGPRRGSLLGMSSFSARGPDSTHRISRPDRTHARSRPHDEQAAALRPPKKNLQKPINFRNKTVFYKKKPPGGSWHRKCYSEQVSCQEIWHKTCCREAGTVPRGWHRSCSPEQVACQEAGTGTAPPSRQRAKSLAQKLPLRAGAVPGAAPGTAPATQSSFCARLLARCLLP